MDDDCDCDCCDGDGCDCDDCGTCSAWVCCACLVECGEDMDNRRRDKQQRRQVRLVAASGPPTVAGVSPSTPSAPPAGDPVSPGDVILTQPSAPKADEISAPPSYDEVVGK